MADEVQPARSGASRERAIDVGRIERPVGGTFEHAVRDAVLLRLFGQARREETVGGDQTRPSPASASRQASFAPVPVAS